MTSSPPGTGAGASASRAVERPHSRRPRGPAAQQEKSRCAIKGNISKSGTGIYHVPGGRFYDQTRIDTSRGERWFCTEAEARAAGWRRSRHERVAGSRTTAQPAAPRPAAQQKKGRCAIKGNISKSGTRIYHVPGGRFYDQTRIDTPRGASGGSAPRPRRVRRDGGVQGRPDTRDRCPPRKRVYGIHVVPHPRCGCGVGPGARGRCP